MSRSSVVVVLALCVLSFCVCVVNAREGRRLEVSGPPDKLVVKSELRVSTSDGKYGNKFEMELDSGQYDLRARLRMYTRTEDTKSGVDFVSDSIKSLSLRALPTMPRKSSRHTTSEITNL